MLAYILSIVVAVFSLIIFGLAFFAPSLHRRDDFLWSGVGLFYALVLWLCASQITGAVLLGQTAAAIMLLSFGWQTLKFRDAIAHPEKGIDLSFSVIDSIENFLGSSKSPKVAQPSTVIHSDEPPITETLSSVQTAVTEKVSDFVEDNKIDEKVAEIQSEVKEVVADAKAATSSKEGFNLKKFLNFRKKTPIPTPTPIVEKTTLDTIDDFEIAVEQIEPQPPIIIEPEPTEPEIQVDRFVPSNSVESPLDPENIEINQSSPTVEGEEEKPS
ncbi:hypothetical protein C7H19_08825 [Aphanothece hegewaldii CCALA 016]|uniref:Ycf66 family protein n=1 Tax=Aphanothece hegewaldii CCALA 016 TaxID=2107694 RepID=A0A2T1LZ47_9CHRO|nr:Ycf66 family protein [Aphanothece hegewaldii]PSF37648.1 hypothetical protein C7H19_08825 [Aphanothece hegewaldii CCALA 016]